MPRTKIIIIKNNIQILRINEKIGPRNMKRTLYIKHWRTFQQEQNTLRFIFPHNCITYSLISAAFIGGALRLWTFQIDFTRSTYKESTPNKYWRVLARVYQRQPFVTHRLNSLKRNSCKMLHKVPYQREGGRKYLFRKLVKTELSKVRVLAAN